MRDKGYDNATVGAVMKAVGLTHGGFYAHFPDKTVMLTAAVQATFVESPANFTFLADMARLHRDAGIIAKHYFSDRRGDDVATGCPAAALVSETPRQNDAIRIVFQTRAEETVRALSATSGLSMEDNGNAWAALSMLVGGLTMMRAINDKALAGEIRGHIITALQKLTTPPTSSKTVEKDIT
jgi:TetR/AcrR family transcriptional regulator, transcriptional repressor for nem operon